MSNGPLDPPPVQPTEDGWQHRRASDDGDREPVHHRRAMDRVLSDTKVQIGIILGIVTLVGGIFAGGYAVRDFMREVEQSPGRWQQVNTINAQQWEAINHNTQSISSLSQQLDQALSMLEEVRCIVRSENVSEQRDCIEEEAERRLENLRRGRGSNP